MWVLSWKPGITGPCDRHCTAEVCCTPLFVIWDHAPTHSELLGSVLYLLQKAILKATLTTQEFWLCLWGFMRTEAGDIFLSLVYSLFFFIFPFFPVLFLPCFLMLWSNLVNLPHQPFGVGSLQFMPREFLNLNTTSATAQGTELWHYPRKVQHLCEPCEASLKADRDGAVFCNYEYDDSRTLQS